MCSAFRWEYPLTIVACALNTGIRHATTLRIHRPFCGIRDVRQCTYNAILRRVRATIVAVEKAGNVFVALVSSMATARAILSSVTCPALQFFSTSPHKRNDFRKDVIERKIRFLNFSTKFDRNISHSKKNWGRYDKKCILVFMWSTPVTRPILMKIEFSWHIFEKYSNIKFNKIRPVGAELFHVNGRMDRRTHMTKLIVAFRNFANAPKKKVRLLRSTYTYKCSCFYEESHPRTLVSTSAPPNLG